jgi:CBS domain-containing protein
VSISCISLTWLTIYSGDAPLAEALTILHNEGVSSLAIIDNSSNVVGNISVADVKLLTKSSSIQLLRNSCLHFTSVILTSRGMYEGKDSFPVFHVTPMNTLAHTVAKLVATKSHRLWITEPVSPSSSGPPTPSLGSATLAPVSSHSSSISAGSGQHHIVPPPMVSADPGSVADASPKAPFVAPLGPTISASAMPGARISGKLVGVVSLTDILILFAKAGGLHAVDPQELRMRRRRSSSSSVRQSIDLGLRPRPSTELTRKISGG